MRRRLIHCFSMLVLFTSLPLTGAHGADSGKTAVALPKPGFVIDRRRLANDRAARAHGVPYRGPIIDVHLHLNVRDDEPASDSELRDILGHIRKAGVEGVIVMPTPNEGRRRRSHNRRQYRRKFQKLGGNTVRLMCCGSYLGQWFHNAQGKNVSNEAFKRLRRRLGEDLASGHYLGVGEFGLYHFDKNGRQPVIQYPPNFTPFLATVGLIASLGRWILLHAESVDPEGNSYEDKFFGGIELLYRRNPSLKLIIPHTATTNPDNVRRLLTRHPTLMMDFKFVGRLGNWHHTEPVHNADKELHEDWARLFEAMPSRFMVGTDAKFYRRGFDGDDYRRLIERFRRVLGGLNPQAARLIGHENARRIFSMPGPGAN
ncbi:MAG: amidohydrolase family protein [Alphaproteobacteria bacterium]